ncbi:MAG: ATP-binding protein, partial [Alphaproteobacteria bacterium]|nr:ATP-binding protein [Alphaproteobacteria bacterium]
MSKSFTKAFYGLLLLSIVLFSAVFFSTAAQLVRVMVQLSAEKPENALWMSGRMAVTFRNLENAILQYELTPDEVQMERFKTALDVAWSSIGTFHENASEPFRSTYLAQQQNFQRLQKTLDQLDFYLDGLVSEETAGIDRIKRELRSVMPEVDRVNLYVLQVKTQDLNRLRLEQQERVYDLIWQCIIWITMVILTVLFVYRNYRRKKSRVRKLKESKNLFAELVSHAAFGISLTDANGKTIVQNQALEKLAGAGRTKSEALLSSLVQERLQVYEHENGHVSVGQDVNLGAGGSLSLRVDMDRVLKELQNLHEALQNHESAASAKADFLATMSHEMRTPLNGVLGLLGLVLDGKLDPEQRGYILTARESAEILLSLIEDILDYSKIEAGKLEFERTDFSVYDLVAGVADILAPRSYEKSIEIAWHVDPLVPDTLRGDPGRLRQILLNLAGNAVKFTEHGGVTIEIAIVAEKAREIMISGLVSDTGIGIPYEAQDQMFGEFNQLDASYSRRFGGSGLGLAITRRLVEAMGGSISVSSEPGLGSQFSFTVLMEKSEILDRQAPADIQEQRRVLVWGEGGITLKSLLRSIKALGHRPILGDTDNIFKSLENENFDLIFIDCRPNRNLGHRVFESLCEANVPLPIFVLQTARNAEVPMRFLGDDPVRQVIQKPFHMESLDYVLKNLRADAKFSTQNDSGNTLVEAPENRRLLLVEDSATNRTVASVILRRVGYMVDWATDGVEAVEAVQNLPYDLVLMDISMPNMDGVEAARIIRSLPGGLSDIPIIALTAHAMPGD